MKPNFALSLSFKGITLLHRAAGGWRRVGEVAVDSDDLAGRLSGLRSRALALEPDGLRCKLIIPNDQIRYMTLDTGAVSGDERLAAARAGLHGATPYALDELAFDISVDGPRTHVAAVARETLAEAESFAVEHRFNPVSFVAAPGENGFLGEPFFGPSRHAASLAGGDKVEADGIAVVVIGDVLPPAEPAADTPAPAPSDPAPGGKPDAGAKPVATPRPVAAVKPPPAPGFSSRRARATAPATSAKPTAPAPKAVGPARRAPVEPPPRRLTLAPAEDAKPAAAPAPKLAAVKTAAPTPVAAPRPEAPAFAAPPQDPAARSASTIGRLGGRLGFGGKAEKPAVAPAAIATAAGRAVPTSPRIEELPPDDETARLTLFGARAPAGQRGKPRHLGLILTAALLLVLAAIAAWASIFLDDGLAGLWRRGSEAEQQIAVAPDPAPTPEPAATPPAEPQTALPQLSALPDPVAVPLGRDPAEPDAAAQTDGIEDQAAPVLSDTDSAVLDALRDAAPADPEQRALYAATGIWDQAPEVPETPSIIGLDDLYVASIDRTDLSQDAVALPPAPDLATDLPFHSVGSPPAAGTSFELGEDGLVVATAAGALNPDGVMVYLGRPPRVPPAPPDRADTAADEADALRARLAGFRPRARPGDLVERAERSQLGGKSREELARLRPKPRPANLPVPAAPATEQPAPETAAEPAPAEGEFSPTAAVVAAAPRPRARPSDLNSGLPEPAGRDAAAAAARSDRGGTGGTVAEEADDEPEVATASVAPSAPSSASVTRQATVRNAINLSKLNLIGVYGTPANRRALVRLPSGRYKKVKVGDTVDGGRIVAIGDSELRYQKGGRNMTLKMPRG